MKILKIAALILLLFGISSTPTNTFSNVSVIYKSSAPINSYDVRVYIDGKWYIITYNSDGYIVNIVEDDE